MRLVRRCTPEPCIASCRFPKWTSAILPPCRVYKNYDPRATIIREVAEEVFEIAGRDPLIDVAVELERIARSDDYFIKRSLYPNVDFYSGAAGVLCSLSRHLHVWRRNRT